MNWYRAIRRAPLKPRVSYGIPPPVLMVWGMKDIYGVLPLAEESVMLCDKGKLLRFDGATHWVLSDEAEAVTQAMIDFFKA